VLVKGVPETRPQRLYICKINCTGRLADNGEVVEEMKDFVFQLGDSEVVQGLDMAIALMDEGEKAEITCNARFAYGSIGLQSKNIPADATIIYQVEMISNQEENDLEKKSYSARKEIGNKKRERGNFFFERQEYNSAIQLYRRALEYLDESEGGITSPTLDGELETTNAQLQDLLEDRIKVYNNMAQAQMKIQAFDAALKSVDTVLGCQPNNVKALFRKGKILEAKADVSGAIPLLRKAATLDPDNKSIQNELSRLILKSKREARNEKDLYAKMLGHAQTLDTTSKTQQKKQTSTAVTADASNKLKLWSYTLGSVLISVAAMALYRYKYTP
jgi:FK506-binding protein 8